MGSEIGHLRLHLKLLCFFTRKVVPAAISKATVLVPNRQITIFGA